MRADCDNAKILRFHGAIGKAVRLPLENEDGVMRHA